MIAVSVTKRQRREIERRWREGHRVEVAFVPSGGRWVVESVLSRLPRAGEIAVYAMVEGEERWFSVTASPMEWSEWRRLVARVAPPLSGGEEVAGWVKRAARFLLELGGVERLHVESRFGVTTLDAVVVRHG